VAVVSAYLVVDAGTSRTRVRSWRDGRIVDEVEERVGAKDVALAGNPAPIADALRRLVAELGSRHRASPEALVCSGMITSNVGLVEVPHVSAPVGLRELGRRLVRHDLPDVTPLPVYFVPGVKTVFGAYGAARGANGTTGDANGTTGDASSAVRASGAARAGVGWDDLAAFDVMRGEEVEVVGLLATQSLSLPVAFFHCGSHHKLIEVAAGVERGDAVVLRSSTAITGELLAAIRERTILASSLSGLDGLEIDPAAVAAGVARANELGFARAAFLVRVGQTIAGMSRDGVTSFLLGALLALDLQLLERELPPARELVVYGGGVFPGLLHDALQAAGRPVRRVAAEDADRSAVVGAVRLLEAFLHAERGVRA